MVSHSSSRLIGAFLVLLGLGLLVGKLLGFSFGIPFVHWSLFIIIPGLAMVLLALTSESAGKILVPLGVAVATTGLLLAYQDWANHFQSWAYAWILTGPAAVGLGLLIHGHTHDNVELEANGRRMFTGSLVAFLLFAIFFEFVLNISGFGRDLSMVTIAAVCLIIGGIVVFVRK